MTLKEIKDFQDNAGKMEEDSDGEEDPVYISLFGYTSCSLSENKALSFAWENEQSGHHKVLFHIIWKNWSYNYFLNAGGYDHE